MLAVGIFVGKFSSSKPVVNYWCAFGKLCVQFCYLLASVKTFQYSIYAHCCQLLAFLLSYAVKKIYSLSVRSSVSFEEKFRRSSLSDDWRFIPFHSNASTISPLTHTSARIYNKSTKKYMFFPRRRIIISIQHELFALTFKVYLYAYFKSFHARFESLTFYASMFSRNCSYFPFCSLM